MKPGDVMWINYRGSRDVQCLARVFYRGHDDVPAWLVVTAPGDEAERTEDRLHETREEAERALALYLLSV